MAAQKRSATLSHVHETPLSLDSIELSPPHDRRTESPEYEKAHHFLVYTKNAPCAVCGVTRRTLGNPKRNLFQATAMETHHTYIEYSLRNACDWRKVHARFPSVYSRDSLERWIDSPENLTVLCSTHHRSLQYGIHHLSVPDWNVLPFLRRGYIVAASRKDAAAVEATDEQIMQAAGLEPPDLPPAA